MAEPFYPFVDSGEEVTGNQHIVGNQGEQALTPAGDGRTPPTGSNAGQDASVARAGEGSRETAEAEIVRYPARIAVYDDMLSTPRVVVVEAKDIRSYLEDVTNTVSKLAKEQGSGIPFMVIREIVENFIHAAFIEPTVSILDDGNTIRFADQGPGIANKELALEPGMTSADARMKKYIRGVGSGFPTVQQYLDMVGGKLVIEDNMGAGTVVTVTVDSARCKAAYEGNAFHSSPQPAQGSPLSPVAAPSQPAYVPSGSGTPVGAQMPPQAPYPYQQPGIAAPPYGTVAQGYPYQQPYPPNYGFPQTYPQPGVMFSTPAVGVGGMPQQAAGPASPQVNLSDRGAMALSYMQEHGACGPTDLARAFGLSNPTWSRELGTLADTGLVMKRGQKYALTELGRTWNIA